MFLRCQDIARQNQIETLNVEINCIQRYLANHQQSNQGEEMIEGTTT